LLRKFLEGLMFGAGFIVAAVVLWFVGWTLILPRVFSSGVAETPSFTNPSEAKALESQSASSTPPRGYSFFKDSDSRMKIPPGGGLLAMALTKTPAGAERPNTYQMWLTETSLWQIRTVGDKAEAEKLVRPESADADALHRLFHEKLGDSAKSMMTVDADSIEEMKVSGDAGARHGLNGKLSITAQGAVFVIPNPY
jgi:hypothetical protein